MIFWELAIASVALMGLGAHGFHVCLEGLRRETRRR